jgi:hypothetical protein
LKTFIIAEAGVNHNGDLDRALAMVDAAKAFGADAVKFQTFTTENVMTRSAEKAEYQKRQTGEGSQFDMVKKLELDEAAHRAIVRRCDEIGIEFMSTAFDTGSHELLLGLGIKRIKIPSGEITNWPFIRDLLRADLPIILSTGMATMDEIDGTGGERLCHALAAVPDNPALHVKLSCRLWRCEFARDVQHCRTLLDAGRLFRPYIGHRSLYRRGRPGRNDHRKTFHARQKPPRPRPCCVDRAG